MTIMDYRRRVAAYVTRAGADGHELLVFDHVDDDPDHPSGTQVPAGGMLPFEAVDDAAFREVTEETGVTGASFVRQLGGAEGPDGLGRPSMTTYVHLSVEHDGSTTWVHQVPGATAPVDAAYLRAQRVWENEGGAGPADPWSPTTHHPHRQSDSDAGMLFACRWEPLPLALTLAADQGAFLDELDLA